MDLGEEGVKFGLGPLKFLAQKSGFPGPGPQTGVETGA